MIAGDVITTGADSEVVFVSGKDAFLIRANSRVEAQSVVGPLVLSGLRVLTGAVLSVFAPGEAEIVSTADPSAREIVRTQHHEQPRYVMGAGAPQMLMGAPVMNHSDAELTLLESLTGRRPPFLDTPGIWPGRY